MSSSPVSLRTLAGKVIPLAHLDSEVFQDNDTCRSTSPSGYLDVNDSTDINTNLKQWDTSTISSGAVTSTATERKRVRVQRNISELLMLTCGISADHALRRAGRVQSMRTTTRTQMTRHEYDFATCTVPSTDHTTRQTNTNTEYHADTSQHTYDNTVSEITNDGVHANTVLSGETPSLNFVSSDNQPFPNALTAIQEMRSQLPLLKQEVGILKEKLEVARRMGLPSSTRLRADAARYADLQVKIVGCESHATQLESGAGFWNSQILQSNAGMR